MPVALRQRGVQQRRALENGPASTCLKRKVRRAGDDPLRGMDPVVEHVVAVALAVHWHAAAGVSGGDEVAFDPVGVRAVALGYMHCR